MADYTGTIKDFIENEMISNNPGTILSISDSLIENGIVDSLGVQVLIAYLEKKFGISVADNDIIPENFDTISSVANLVNLKLNGIR